MRLSVSMIRRDFGPLLPKVQHTVYKVFRKSEICNKGHAHSTELTRGPPELVQHFPL
jgi:hypothetical protein